MPDIVGSFAQLIRIGRVHAVDLGTVRCTIEIGDPELDGFVTAPVQWLAVRAA